MEYRYATLMEFGDPWLINLVHSGSAPSRHVELDIDIGADAKDWNAIQAGEKLKPVEGELRRIEEVVGEIVSEMDYLRSREMKLRDTNESTNERVKWFSIMIMGVLVSLGGWQIVYLRAYFRYVLTWAENDFSANHKLDLSILSKRFILVYDGSLYYIACTAFSISGWNRYIG